ncbi:MAG: hypothetical protein LBL23_02075, partial [Coriobacteriales bacterium]|nr:hypothetical protein [Coriobacteriales bacterium]
MNRNTGRLHGRCSIGAQALSLALILFLVVGLIPALALTEGQERQTYPNSQFSVQEQDDPAELSDEQALSAPSIAPDTSSVLDSFSALRIPDNTGEILPLGEDPDPATDTGINVTLLLGADSPTSQYKTYQSGQTTGLTAGKTMVTFSGIPTYAIIIPVPDPDFAGAVSDVYAGNGLYVDNSFRAGGLDFYYTDKFGRLKHAQIAHAVVVWGTTQTTYQPTVSFDLGYPNGTTPNNTELPLNVIALPATNFTAGQTSGGEFLGSGAPGIPGTAAAPYDGADSQIDPADPDAGSRPWPVTLRWTAQDDFTLTKSFVSATSNGTQGTQTYPELIQRSYTNVELAKDNSARAENTYTATYRLSLNTNGITGGSDTGRYFQEYLTVHDSITGLAPGVAPGIRVSADSSSATALVVTPDTSQLASGILSFSFNVPELSNSAGVNARDFYVQLSFSKNDYTAFATSSNPLFSGTVPITLSNTGTLTYKPVPASSPITTAPSNVNISLGWKQQQPTRPTLTIRKKLTVSPGMVPLTALGYQGTRDYTAALASLYEGKSYNPGDESGLRFLLYKSSDNGTSVSEPVAELPLKLNDDERNTPSAASYSTAYFGELLPGTYYVKETTAISSGVPAEATPHWITVSDPNASTGLSAVTVDGVAVTGTDAEMVFDNTATTVGRVMVSVLKQLKYQNEPLTGNPIFQEFAHAVVQLRDAGGTVVQTATADTNGNVYFENVPEGAVFSLSDGGSPDVNTPTGWVLDTRANDAQANRGSTLTGIKADAENLTTGAIDLHSGNTTSDYVLRYIANSGSFSTGKFFVGPGGAQVPVDEIKNHYANFAAYYAADHTDDFGETHTKGQFAGRFTVYGAQSSLSAVAADLPPGSFYLVEESLYIGGETSTNVNGNPLYDRRNEYDLINNPAPVPGSPSFDADVARAVATAGVTIVSGSYTTHATGTALGTTPGVDQYYLRNVSRMGIMGIHCYDFLYDAAGSITKAYGGDFLVEAVAANGEAIPQGEPGYYHAIKTVRTNAENGSDLGYLNFSVPLGRYRVSLDTSAATGQTTTAALGNVGASAGSSAAQTRQYAYVSVTADTASVDAASVAYRDKMLSIDYGTSVEMAYFVLARTPRAQMYKTRGDNGRGLSGARLALYKLNEQGTAYELLPSTANSTATAAGVFNVSFGRSTLAGAGNLSEGSYAVVESLIPSNFNAPEWSTLFYADPSQGTLGTGVALALKPSVSAAAVEAANCPRFTVSLEQMRSLSAPENGANAPASVVFEKDGNGRDTNTIINTPLVNLRVKAVEATNTTVGYSSTSSTATASLRNAGGTTPLTSLAGLPIAGASYELYQNSHGQWTKIGVSAITKQNTSYASDYYAPNYSVSYQSSTYMNGSGAYYTHFFAVDSNPATRSYADAIRLGPGQYTIRQVSNPTGIPSAPSGAGTSTHYVDMKPEYAFSVNEKAEIVDGAFTYTQNANLAGPDEKLHNAGAAKNAYYSNNNATGNADTLYVAFSYLAAPTHDYQKRGETVGFHEGSDQARITVPRNGAEFNLYAVPAGEDRDSTHRVYWSLNASGVVTASASTTESMPKIYSGTTTTVPAPAIDANGADRGYIAIRNFDANLPNAYEYNWYLEEVKAPAYTPTDSPNDDAQEYGINPDNPLCIDFFLADYSATLDNCRVGVHIKSNYHGTGEMRYGAYRNSSTSWRLSYSTTTATQDAKTPATSNYRVTRTDSCYVCMNILEEYWIHVFKLPLVPGSGGVAANPAPAPYPSSYTLDLKAGDLDNSGESNWVKIAVYNARFAIYKLEAGETYPGQNGGIPDLVDIISTGGRVQDILRNDAKSKALPAGNYWVCEITSGLNYSAIDDYEPILHGSSAGAYQNWEGSNTVFVHTDPNLAYDKDDPADNYAPADPYLEDQGEWIPAVDGGDFANGWPVTVSAVDPETNPSTEDRTYDLVFGNSNRLDANRGDRADTYLQLHGTKLGYSYEPNMTLSTERRALSGIEFKVWPAYRLGNGEYRKLQTFGNEPLATVRTNSNGVFELGHLNISAAYQQYGRDQGSTADVWTYQDPRTLGIAVNGAVNWNSYTSTATGSYDGYSWMGDEFVQDVSLRGYRAGEWCLIFEEIKASLPEGYRDDALLPVSKINSNLGMTGNLSFYWRWTEPSIKIGDSTQPRGGIFEDPNNPGGSPYTPQQEYRMEWSNNRYGSSNTHFDEVATIPAAARDNLASSTNPSNLSSEGWGRYSDYWIIPNYQGAAELCIIKNTLADELLPDANSGGFIAAINSSSAATEGDRVNGAYYNLYQVSKAALAMAGVSTGEYDSSDQRANLLALRSYFALNPLSTLLNPSSTASNGDLRLVTQGTLEDIGTATKMLHPGYYFLVEQDTPLNYNRFGRWSIDFNADRKEGSHGSNNNGGLESAVFGTSDTADWIGPFELRGSDDYRGNNAGYEVTVSNKIKPRLSIRNFWNTLASSDNSYTASYRLYKGTAVTAENLVETKQVSGTNTVTFDYKISSTVSAPAAKDGTLGLPDGSYTIVESGIGSATGADYIPNPAASKSSYIVITVENGEISTVTGGSGSGGGEAVYFASHDPEAAGRIPAFTPLGLRFDRDTNTLDVNQPSQGALIIQIGLIDAQKNRITDLNADQFTGWYTHPDPVEPSGWQYGKGFWSETFELQVQNSTGSFVAPEAVFDATVLSSFGLDGAGTIRWNALPNANTDGLRQKLPPNQLYRIKAVGSEQYREPGVAETKWTLDLNNTQSWFYFEISENGVVYLTNTSLIEGGTADNPVQGAVIAQKAYFFNESTSGTFALYITDSRDTGNTHNIGGRVYPGFTDTAVLELYASTGPGSTTPTGPLLATIRWNQTAWPSFDAAGTNPIDTTTGYEFTAPAGHYVVRETAAPLDGDLAFRTNEYFALEVLAAEDPDYRGYNTEDSSNALGIYNPQITYLNATKEVVYPAVAGGSGAERRVRVSSFPVTLLRLQDQYYDPSDPATSLAAAKAAADITMWDDWDTIRTASETTTTTVKDISRFRIARTGVYMLVERERYIPEVYDYIKINEKYTYDREEGEPGATTGQNLFPSCEPLLVSFDEESGTLVIATDETDSYKTGIEGNPAAGGTSILGYDNLTTITNPFDGYQIAAQKRDYMSGTALDPYTSNASSYLSPTWFALYDADVYSREEALADDPLALDSHVYYVEIPDPNNPALTTNVKQFKATSDGSNGTVYFDPMYLNPSATAPRNFWVREVVAPTGLPVNENGYVLDSWYDESIKKVSMGEVDENGTKIAFATALFSDGRSNEDEHELITLDKGIKVSASEGASTIEGTRTEEVSLASGPITETYVLTPGGEDTSGTNRDGAINNGLPLFNYRVYDPGFSFTGADGRPLAVGTAGAQGTTVGYSITRLRLAASSAYASAAAQKTDTPTAVYASVNGSDWQLLNQQREFMLGDGNGATSSTESQEVTIRYSMVVPETGNDPYGAAVTDSNYYVGSYFKPGAVEMDVVFNQFKPTAEQAEVGSIKNTAAVYASLHGSSAKSSSSNEAELSFTVNTRPSMDISKELTGYSGGSLPLVSPAKGGEQLSYTIIASNTADPDELGITAPVLLDWLEESAVNYVQGSAAISVKRAGDADYAPYTRESVFTQDGSILKWVFPADETLALGDSLKLELTVEIGDIVPRGAVRNEAYATSATALEYSNSYPSGASFVAAQGMSSSQAVWAGNANALTDWTRLTNAGQSGYGLLVKAVTSDTAVMASADPKIVKSIAVNDGSYMADVASANRADANVAVTLGDTINYRLQHMSGQFREKNLRIIDVLPSTNDSFFTGGSRGTTWSQALLDCLEFDPSSVTVSTTVNNTPVAVPFTLKAYDERNINALYAGQGTAAADEQHPQALVIDTGSFELGTVVSGEIQPQLLTVEFSLKLRSDLTQAQKNTLFSSDAQKLLANNMAIGYTTITPGTDISMPAPAERERAVYARFVADEVAISGKTWEDKDQDGLSNSSTYVDSDPAKPGISVDLYKFVGAVADLPDMGTVDLAELSAVPGLSHVAQTTSGTDGSYSFEHLESSYNSTSSPAHELIHYLVGYRLPSGFYWTTPNAGSSASDAFDSDATFVRSDDTNGFSHWFTAGNDVAHVDAGMYTTAVIKGRVWLDDNNNGLQDAGEGIVPGGPVTVTLYSRALGGAYNQVASTSTHATDGSYEFSNINIKYGPTSTYRVVVDKNTVAHANYTYAWTQTKVATGGTGTLVYPEVDSDVTPLLADLSTYDASDRTLRYAGVELTPAYGSTTAFTDAGIVPVGRVIKGRLFEDRNQDGLQSSELDPTQLAYEGGIAGATVYLYEGSDTNLIDQSTTDANGRYTFGLGDNSTLYEVGPLDGTKSYYVGFDRPNTTGWAYTQKNVGSNTAIDSDVFASGSSLGKTEAITAPNYTTDAGIYKLTTVSGIVWRDANNDGMKGDADDFGFTAESAGADLLPVSCEATLQKPDGSGGWTDVASKTISAGDAQGKGSYSFGQVAPGSYRVVFDRTDIQSYTEGYEWTVENHLTAPLTDNRVTGVAHEGQTGRASLLGTTPSITVVYADYALADSTKRDTGYDENNAGIHPLLNAFNGRVWNDYNHDGLQDANEPALEGIEVTLLLSEDGTSWAQHGTAQATDANGSYRLVESATTGLSFAPYKEYRIGFKLPGSSWKWTTPYAAGIDPEIDYTLLDSDACYTEATDDVAETASLELIRVNSGPIGSLDAGMYEPGTISGGLGSQGLAGVWRDANDNGVQDPEELLESARLDLGVADDGIFLTIALYRSVDADGIELPTPELVATTVIDTADECNYAFADLTRGTYFLELDRSQLANTGEDYTWALPDQGSNPALASRFTPYDSSIDAFDTSVAGRQLSLARSGLIALGYGSTNSATDGAVGDPYNAGIVPYLHIVGFAWWDTNRNGARGEDEVGFGEVRTSLYRNDELVATTNTASDGSYRFDHQPVAGSYKVGF